MKYDEYARNMCMMSCASLLCEPARQVFVQVAWQVADNGEETLGDVVMVFRLLLCPMSSKPRALLVKKKASNN